MTEPTYENLREFFVKKAGSDDKLIPYESLEKEFGVDGAYSLHERGLIYEPILGQAKLI